MVCQKTHRDVWRSFVGRARLRSQGRCCSQVCRWQESAGPSGSVGQSAVGLRGTQAACPYSPKPPQTSTRLLGWPECLRICCRDLFLWDLLDLLACSGELLGIGSSPQKAPLGCLSPPHLPPATCSSFTNERTRQPCANARKSIAHKKIHVINQLHKHSCQKMQ